MNSFDRWLSIILGIFFIITGIVDMIQDCKKRTAWWRRALDIFGIILGAWFVYGFFM